jgi:hypothetical protein
MFAAVAVLMVLASPVGEIVETTRSLELSLKVVEAFEHGPVILDVTLTNRGKKALKVRTYSLIQQSSIVPPVEWKAWEPVRFGCAGTQDDPMLEPGMRLTERHILHQEYVSRFPAGEYRVIVNWTLLGPPRADEVAWHILAMLKKTFPVTISPATPANRYALAARLEAEYKSLPPGARGDFEDPLWQLGNQLLGVRHKELIPLALEMLDRARPGPEFDLTHVFREQMASMVLGADPAKAHQTFVDRLLANPPRIEPSSVFRSWQTAAGGLGEISQALLARLTNVQCWTNPALFKYLWPEDELMSLLRWANDSVPCILPDNELRRLSSAKDFTVRAWIYHTFGRRLGPAWCDEFLKEARRAAETKPDAKKPQGLDPALEELIFTLVYGPENTHNKHLLDIFLAGAKDNPIAIASREELAEYEKRKQDKP